MNEEPSFRRSVSAEELRALYDIRVKEVHHYNTSVWAFPIVFVTLVAGEYRYLGAGSVLLFLAAIFNFCLWYVFHRHLKNKKHIQKTLKFTEDKLAELYGKEFVPDFPRSSGCFPKATQVMWLALTAITVAFLVRAIVTMYPDEDCCRCGLTTDTATNSCGMTVPLKSDTNKTVCACITSTSSGKSNHDGDGVQPQPGSQSTNSESR